MKIFLAPGYMKTKTAYLDRKSAESASNGEEIIELNIVGAENVDKVILWQEFLDLCKPLFDKHPEMQSFSWKQYTDYFNDGSPVNFSVYTDCPDINNEKGYNIHAGYDWIIKDNKYQKVKTQKEHELYYAQNSVGEFLAEYIDNNGSEKMLYLFGDHKKISVIMPTKDSELVLKTEDYTNHD